MNGPKLGWDVGTVKVSKDNEIKRLREALESIKKRCVESNTISPINDLRVIRNIAKEATK